LGHARLRLPAPEREAVPADRQGGCGAAGRPARKWAAREHTDRHGGAGSAGAPDHPAPPPVQAPRPPTPCGRGAAPRCGGWGAGGGVRGGTVVGSSDKIGGHPASDPQTPENMAATIYHSLGIPETMMWHDALNRPHHIYYGKPIAGLS